MGGIRLISIQGPRAGEVARQEIGRSGDWLRKLERAGVIPAAPRDFNGYRVYPPEFVGASTVGRLPRHGRQKGRRGKRYGRCPIIASNLPRGRPNGYSAALRDLRRRGSLQARHHLLGPLPGGAMAAGPGTGPPEPGRPGPAALA